MTKRNTLPVARYLVAELLAAGLPEEDVEVLDIEGYGVLTAAGEPVVYEVRAAGKTYATWKITTANPGGHSSRPLSGSHAATLHGVGRHRRHALSQGGRAHLGD